MTEALTIWTYDWVPEGKPVPVVMFETSDCAGPAKKPAWTTKSGPSRSITADAEHFSRQPFGQVPFIEDRGITVFESGACLLHLARKSETLMPRDPKGEAETLEWTIAALNSIEMVTVPWWFIGLSNAHEQPARRLGAPAPETPGSRAGAA